MSFTEKYFNFFHYIPPAELHEKERLEFQNALSNLKSSNLQDPTYIFLYREMNFRIINKHDTNQQQQQFTVAPTIFVSFSTAMTPNVITAQR